MGTQGSQEPTGHCVMQRPGPPLEPRHAAALPGGAGRPPWAWAQRPALLRRPPTATWALPAPVSPHVTTDTVRTPLKAAEGKRAGPVRSGGCSQPWSPLGPFQQCCLAGGSAVLPRTQGSLPRTICRVQGIGGLDLTRGSLPRTVWRVQGMGCLDLTRGSLPGTVRRVQWWGPGPDSGVST